MVGTTWSRVVHMVNIGSHYEIDTPAAYAFARGTAFTIGVSENGATTLQVSEGTVAVQAQGKQVLVSAGYQDNIEPGKDPGEPLSSVSFIVQPPTSALTTTPTHIPTTETAPIALPSTTPEPSPIRTR